MFTTNNSPPADQGIPPDADGLKGVDGLRLWLPIIFGVTAYLNLLTSTGRLLIDSDVYWHIAVGQWIVDHRAVPHADPFSFTMRGAPWITSAWLSEVLYFAAFKVAGWAGPVVLAASSVAAMEAQGEAGVASLSSPRRRRAGVSRRVSPATRAARAARTRRRCWSPR